MIAYIRNCMLSLTLAGCAAMPQEHVTTVEVPVSVPCRITIGADPTYVDTKEALRAAPGVDIRVNLLLAGRIQRDRRIDDLKASVAGCVFTN